MMLLLLLVGVVPLQQAAAAENDNFTRLSGGLIFDNETELKLNLQKNAEMLEEWENDSNNSALGFDVSIDNYQSLPSPPCYQQCNEWCWAAVLAMVSNYYHGGTTCQGVECRVASVLIGTQCCPWTSVCRHQVNDPPGGCNRPATPGALVIGGNKMVGRPFKQDGPLSQRRLYDVLKSGRIIMYGVKWNNGRGGHVLLIGGMNCGMFTPFRSCRYYVHDPWIWYSRRVQPWQALSYGQLMRYPDPGGTGILGLWTISIYMIGVGDPEMEAIHQDMLQTAAQKRAMSDNTSTHSLVV